MGLDLRKKLAHIDQQLADHDHDYVRDRERLRSDWKPWLLAIAGMTAGKRRCSRPEPSVATFMKLFPMITV